MDMDMGGALPLGSFESFIALWVLMMAAMMLPGALPAIRRYARADSRLRAMPLFVVSYLAVWTLVGVAIYALYRPHAFAVESVLVIAAGVYELTRFKRNCRRRCSQSVASGFEYGLYCVGSSIGLMLMLVALGVMSITWMAVIGGVVVAQKLLPPKAIIDVPVALAIIACGIAIS